MKFTKPMVALAATGLLTGLTLVATEAPAAAVPSNCTITDPSFTATQSRCTAGTGQQRVVVVWRFVNPHMPQDWHYTYGNWASVGATSTSYHAGGSEISEVYLEKR